jgi:hypothetical protein
MFEAMQVDAPLVPERGVAHEVYAQVSTPMLWRFIQEMPAQGTQWAADPHPAAAVQLRSRAPSPLEGSSWIGSRRRPLAGWLSEGKGALGTCLRSPEIGTATPGECPLLLLRDGMSDPHARTTRRCWTRDDELLFAGHGLRESENSKHPR